MFDILAVGEALIDFTPAGMSEGGRNLYERNAGGAPLNLVVAAQRMGAQTAFIGKVGADSQGQYVISEVAAQGVDVSAVVYDPDVYTTLAFVTLNAEGDRDFSFARKPGADTCLRYEEINRHVTEEARALHFGSLGLTAEPARSATLRLADEFRGRGALISFDANYRSFLWSDLSSYRARVSLAISKADVIKISEEEAEIITGATEMEEQCRILRKLGPSIVCLTLGANGCYVQTAEGGIRSAARDAGPVIDTTGAGDCFFGSFLSQLMQLYRPLEASLVQLKDIAGFANAAAGICVTRRGGIPSIPSKQEVELLIMKLNKEV